MKKYFIALFLSFSLFYSNAQPPIKEEISHKSPFLHNQKSDLTVNNKGHSSIFDNKPGMAEWEHGNPPV
jgi:hypothetical protein